MQQLEINLCLNNYYAVLIWKQYDLSSYSMYHMSILDLITVKILTWYIYG